MLSPRLIAGALLVVATTAAGDQVYKWVDANGNVTYSSTPPPDAKAAQTVDLPPAPPASEVEAAQEREKSLQELGDQISKERQEREVLRAEERKAVREEAGPQLPAPQQSEWGDGWTSGWWIPGSPGIRPRPPWPERPVPPPPRRDPTAPTDHPAFWAREPILPPGPGSGVPVRPRPR